MKLNEQKIKTIADYFQNSPVINAYLFGSYAREDANVKSDIDILVDLDYTQNIGLHFVQMKLDLERLLNNKVDLVSSIGLSKYVKPLVDNEKKLMRGKLGDKARL